MFFDGGCRPNPGPMEAAVIHRGRVHLHVGLGSGDSHEAEWLALILAARLVLAQGGTDALFVGDAVNVVEQAAGRAPCRDPRVQRYLTAFRETTSRFARVRLRWVPRAKNLAGIALARHGAG